VVLEDEECLLLAVDDENEEQQRVVANIRYKSVEGFAVEK
jgi:hypothetical protein